MVYSGNAEYDARLSVVNTLLLRETHVVCVRNLKCMGTYLTIIHEDLDGVLIERENSGKHHGKQGENHGR